jgi:acetyl-CoA carboxylase biotin carboxylase subunit
VPVIPDSEGVVKSVEDAKPIAEKLGYPVLLKAVAGGGGKGMRLVNNYEELEKAFPTTRHEAEVSFKNPDLYIEKFIAGSRHIEIQIIGDIFGNIIHLNERDCSTQRRHQKLIEESPATIMTEDLRRRMGEAAVKGAKAVNYSGPGTIEFLVDDARDFCFMEMNTRIQVEHPVTEESVDIDLIKEQILVASGEKLSLIQQPPKMHAIECRINAEDPFNDFMPSPGRIESLHLPGGHGIRVDTHIYQDYVIPPYYDSLLAKLIAFAPTRNGAIAKMRVALDEFVIEGIKTTIPFHRKMMTNPDFIAGNIDTKYLERVDWITI